MRAAPSVRRCAILPPMELPRLYVKPGVDLNGLTAAVPDEPTQVTGASATISATAGSIAIVRTTPTTTALQLPTVASRNGQPLPIFDWSTISGDHTITITPNWTEKIMLNATLVMVSTTASLASVTLFPSTTLSGWFIAP